MANRWLYAGSDHLSVRHMSGSPTTATDDALDSGWCNTSISLAAGVRAGCDFTDTSGASDAATTGETLWVHYIRYRAGTPSSAHNEAAISDGSDEAWVAIRWKTSTTYGLYYNSGTGGSPTWTQLGADLTFSLGINYKIDIALTLGSPHSIDLYIDSGGGSSLIISETFTQASFTSADVLDFTGNNGTSRRGSMLASVGIPTINAKCHNRYPSAAGTTNTFTGAYTDIDETGANDADLISSATAGQRATFNYQDVATYPAGFTSTDVFLYTRAKNDGAAPNNLKPVRRDSGGTDNVGTDFSGMGLTFNNFLTRYVIDKTEFNASEFGVESAT